MSTIPTIQQLFDSIINDLKATLRIEADILTKKYLPAYAGVQAAKLHIYYILLADVQKNIFIDTADPESQGGTLERFGRVFLGRDPLPATAGFYQVQITGTIGATINASTTFKSNDDSLSPGNLYILDNAYTLVSTTDSIELRALTVGSEGKLNIGDFLTSTEPILNVDSQAQVTAENVAPTAAETTEDYRQTAIQAVQLEPQGGAVGDYRIWASDVAGVRQVYPFVKSGSTNELDVYLEADPDSSDPVGSGIPPGSMITDVENALELDPDTSLPINERGRRPATVGLSVLAVTPLDIDVTINSLSDQSAAEKTAIQNALEAYLFDIRPAVGGADDPTKINDTIYVSQLAAVISDAISASNNFTSVSFTVDGNPQTTYQFVKGDIPNLDEIFYI